MTNISQTVEAVTIGVAATLVRNGEAVRTDTVSMRVSRDFINQTASVDRTIDAFIRTLADGLSFGAHLSHQRHFAALVAGFVGKSDGFQKMIDANLDGVWLQIHHDGHGAARAKLVGASTSATIDANVEALRQSQLDPEAYAILVGSDFRDIG